jgi:hypothetical protein
MKHWFGDLMLNVFLRMVAGKQCCGGGADCEEGEVQSFENLMGDVSFLFGVFVLSDTISFLGWLDVNGYKKATKRTAKKLDSMIGKLLEEHKQNRLLGGEGKEDQDFMDVMLTILGDAEISGFDADTINKATCLVGICGLLNKSIKASSFETNYLYMHLPAFDERSQENFVYFVLQ